MKFICKAKWKIKKKNIESKKNNDKNCKTESGNKNNK